MKNEKTNKKDSADLRKELVDLDARRLEILKELESVEAVKFPKMVYQDLDGDGDISQASNQLTVNSQAELEAALSNGWTDDPHAAAIRPDKTSEMEEGDKEQAIADGKGNFGKLPKVTTVQAKQEAKDAGAKPKR